MEPAKTKVTLELKVLIGLILTVATCVTNFARNEYKIEKKFIEIENSFDKKITEVDYKNKDQDRDIREVINQQNIDRVIINNIQHEQNN